MANPASATSHLPPSRVHVRQVVAVLAGLYPVLPDFLVWHEPWELMVAVIMSAQTTDAQVNKVTPALFARFPQPAALAAAGQEEVEDLIRSTGFYRVKAKNIRLAAQHLIKEHGGAMPRTMDELVRIPGMGRKSAGVILHHVWHLPAIIVDTHFARVCQRLGLAGSSDPLALEKEIAALVPMAEWSALSMRANQFGREICHARKPACTSCPLAEICPWPERTS